MNPERTKITTEDAYLERLRKGDPQVIRALYGEYFEKIKTLVLRNKGTLADAEDVFQDAIMAIYAKVKKAPEFQLKSSFYGYLYGICRNLWLSELKKRKQSGVTFEDTSQLIIVDIPSDHQIEAQKDRLYREKFALLGPDCKKVLLWFLKGMKLKEIALKMKYKGEQYAKKKKYKCQKQLIEMIKQDPKFNEIKDNA